MRGTCGRLIGGRPRLRPPAGPATLIIVRVSGIVLRSRWLFVRERGKLAEAQVLAALPEDLRAVLPAALETRWYPFEFFTIITETIDRVLGTGDLALAYEMGRFNCDHSLTTVMRLVFKFGNVGWLLDRAAKAWDTQYDEGEEVVLELHGHPSPSRAQCLGIKGWMVRAAEVSGEDRVTCDELCRAAGDAVCRWTFRWR
jgi:hypothetical protein